MRTLIASDFVTSLRAFAAAAPSRIPSTRFQMAQVHPLAIAHASFATHTHLHFLGHDHRCICISFMLHFPPFTTLHFSVTVLFNSFVLSLLLSLRSARLPLYSSVCCWIPYVCLYARIA